MANDQIQVLLAGTILRGGTYSYRIQSVLGQGSFGITYLASTSIRGPLGEVTVPVAVKEFFASELDSRRPDGSVVSRTEQGVAHKYAKAFQRESQNLSKLKHPGIVNVLEAFEANGTYYYSMEYLPGGSLDAKVKGVGMPEAEALPMIEKIGEALSYLHDHKMMHLDLKPKNIMLKDDGSPVIIDFGLSKQYDAEGEPESSSTIGLGTPGYAPIEQANRSSGRLFQPTLDLYALGATLYKMLTGQTPPDASTILVDGLPKEALKAKGVTASTISAIIAAMRPSWKDRPQKVADFLSMLEGKSVEPEDETEPKPSPAPDSAPSPSPASSGRKSKTWLWALLGGLAALAIVLAFVFGGKGRIQGTGGDSGADTLAVAPTEALSEPPVAPPVNEPVPEALGSINGHQRVDLGLSVKWATCNVGASSPEEYGSYFAWGETKSKSDYGWSTLRYCLDSSGYSFSKYNTNGEYGFVDNKSRLDLSDDAARANWGGSWRMPTDAEWTELRTECTWLWTAQGGKNGYKVASKKNGKSIFLPAAGCWDGAYLYTVGSDGYYWSSSLRTSYPSYALFVRFDSGSVDRHRASRYGGFSVRPVAD